jgi:putative polysaccharide biosynthesis protein
METTGCDRTPRLSRGSAESPLEGKPDRRPTWAERLTRRFGRHVRGLKSAWHDSAVAAREHRRSRVALLVEAASLALRGRMAVDTFFHYRLFDRKLTRAAKRRYLPEAPHANERLWHALTPREYGCLYGNKLVFHRFFKSLGLPLAALFGVFDPAVGSTEEGRPLRSAADLTELLRQRGNDGFVLKPVEGVRGHLTLVFRGRAADSRDTYVTLAGERYDAASLVAATRRTAALERQSPGARLSSFLIQERIRPHPELVDFIGPTLCTARVLTIVARDGSPRIVGSVLKVQPSAVGVDHLLYGAVACWIDADTGVLGPGRTRTHCDYVTTVPGTDRPLVGYRVPLWAEVKRLALDAAAAFPWARAIGWDIAVAERGAVLIEGNARWSPSLVQLPAPHGLMDGELEALYRERRGGDAT